MKYNATVILAHNNFFLFSIFVFISAVGLENWTTAISRSACIQDKESLLIASFSPSGNNFLHSF